MTRKRILVTGCSGFVAGYLLPELKKEKEYEIVGCSDRDLPAGCDIRGHKIDLRDRQAIDDLVRKEKPSLVIHLAAVANVGFSWKNQALTYDVNVVGSTVLMEALARHTPGCRLVLMSSAEVYGNRTSGPISEQDPVDPRNPYSLSKLTMEKIGWFYMSTRQLEVIVLRSFNFAGPGQDRLFVTSDFAAQIAEIEAGLRKAKIHVGNLAPRRDFSDVRDAARFITCIALQGRAGECYNIGSGKALPISDMLEKLLGFSRKKIKVITDPQKFRPSDTAVTLADCAKIFSEFKLSPQYSIDQTLEDLLDDWRQKINRGY